MVNYKLTYFDVHGRGEAIRILFHYAGQKFDEDRITFENWTKLKESTPFGQLPYLEVDGQVIAQSQAILRFLGRQFGLAGKNAWEQAYVDQFGDALNDFFNDIRPFYSALLGFGPGDKDKLKEEVFLPNRDKYFALFKKNITGDFLTDSITWVDIQLAQALDGLRLKIPDLYQGFPEIASYVKRVLSTPKIKEYIMKRPDAPF